MKNKVLALCLASVMAVGLVGCGGSSSSSSSSSSSEASAESAEGAEESAETEAAAPADGKVYELKISTTQTETSMIYAGLQAAADKVAEDTNGGVKITIYPSGQLGAEADMIDQALQGMGIGVLTDAGRLSNYVNDIGILNMAYIVENYDDGCKIMDTDTFKGWDSELIDAGIRVLCYNYYDGARSFEVNQKYTTPEEFNGVVIRTPGADPYNESISALGATPYNIDWSEVYNGIQTKSIDGCEAQYTSVVSSAIYEVCDYVIKTEHINLFNMVMVGESWFQSLPEEYQQILTDDFFSCGYESAQSVVAAQEDLEAELVEKGMEIVEVDLDVFKEAAKAAYEKLGWTDLRQQLYEEAGLDY